MLNQKSELERALSKHKDKQILNQVREHRETPGKIFSYKKIFLYKYMAIKFLNLYPKPNNS